MLPFFESVETSALADWIRNSVWISSVVEILHLLGLTLLLGAVLMMSLRLFGLALANRPLSLVAQELRGWTLLGIVTMLGSGVIKFITEPMRLYDSGPYWWKMYFLAAALVFHFTLYRKVTSSDEARPLLRGITGAASIFLWFGVGIFGRFIGFF